MDARIQAKTKEVERLPIFAFNRKLRRPISSENNTEADPQRIGPRHFATEARGTISGQYNKAEPLALG